MPISVCADNSTYAVTSKYCFSVLFFFGKGGELIKEGTYENFAKKRVWLKDVRAKIF